MLLSKEEKKTSNTKTNIVNNIDTIYKYNILLYWSEILFILIEDN